MLEELRGEYSKAKWYDTGRWDSQVRRCLNTTGEEWREIMNNSRNNEVAGQKQKKISDVYVSGDKSKDPCYKELHCIGT